MARSCPITKAKFFFIMNNDAPEHQNKHVCIDNVTPTQAYNRLLKEFKTVSWSEMLSENEYLHTYDLTKVTDANMLVNLS